MFVNIRNAKGFAECNNKKDICGTFFLKNALLCTL